MLGKAPGTALLNEWYGVYNASVGKGMSPEDALLELANHIAASSAFTSMYPFFITNAEFARDFLTAALGEAPSAEVLALATGLLNGGMGRGEMGLLAVQQLFEIRMQGESHPAYGDFGGLAMMFANKVEVATYYTVTKRWEGDSASVLGGVTGDGDSVTAAKEAIDMMRRPGKSFELTTGVDRLDGTLGDDTFVATEKTLTGVDRLDGGEGMDTLELSSSGSDDDVSVSSGASVMHIETLMVDSGGDFEADLMSGWEGLKEVVLSDVAGDVELDAGGAAVSSKSLEGGTVEIMNAAVINLEDVSESTQVNIFGTDTTTSVMVEGGKGVEVGKSTAHSETVKSVTLDGVHDGMGDDKKRYGENTPAKEAEGETPAVAAVNNEDRVPVHIFSKAIESVDLRNTNTTLLVENAAKDMTELTAVVDRFGNTANGHGKLCLKGIEDLMIEVKGDSNIRLASDQIKTVAVSGGGDLTLDVTKFAPAVAKKATDVKPSETLESIDASEASGAVKIAALNKSVMSYMGSMGKDDVSVKEFNAKGLTANLGAGDDMFTATNVKTGKSRIDGGAGMDTLVLKEKIGANLKGAGDAYMNFETITLEAGGGSGTYDAKELDIDNLKVTGGTGAGGVTFKNLMSGTGLAVSSKKPTAADESKPLETKATATTAVVSYMLEDGDDEDLMLHLHTSGGSVDEKLDLGIRNPKTALTLTVDEDVEELTVHSTATVSSKDVKTTDYVNQLTVTGNDSGVEKLKITGDAPVIVFRTIGGETKQLKSLTYVDATENTAGLYFIVSGGSGGPDIEMHGSPANDILVGMGGNTGKSTLMGNDGDDVLAGLYGPDKITGGAGGDRIFLGAANVAVTQNYVDYQSSSESLDDNAEDMIIYKAASDSQVSFGDKIAGFDLIFNFEVRSGKNEDKIDLSPIVDLTGSLQDLNDTNKKNKDKTEDLKTAVGDGKDLFVADATDDAFASTNSVVFVRTTEVHANIKHPEGGIFSLNNNVSFIPGDDTKIQLTWVLVDVDGDGDFSAGTDMAIALAGHIDLGADNFM